MNKFGMVLILAPLWVSGQLEHSLLWQVTKEGSMHKSYLFGSMHTNDSTANTFSESWWTAFDQCDVLASEVDMNEAHDAGAALSGAFMKDTVLQDLYSPNDYNIVMALLKKEFDLPNITLIERLKPFHTLALIMETPENGESVQSVMDVRIQLLAQSKGKKILGLETAREQASSIDILNLHEQADLLLQYAKNESEVKSEFESLKRFYLEQNLDSLSSTKANDYFPEKLVKELVDGRNLRFYEKLSSSIKISNVFCMVGAMHLTGENGLIAMLRKDGYTVEPVVFHFGKG